VEGKTFALDFDDTFTADPGLWSRFIEIAQKRGHRFYCVTARRETEENVDHINAEFDHWQCQMPIIFSNLRSKTEHLDKLGIKIDIWIDDAPYALVHGHV
jgi:acid phosphatase class B